MAVYAEAFGKNCYGDAVDLFTLTNCTGMRVRIMTHGATLVSVETPDRTGQMADVVLGHDRAAEYTEDTPYFGCVVGRFANRIKEGRFELDGKVYQLAVNNGPNALHGGLRGFDKVIWVSQCVETENAVRLSYVSADGEEGYPGEVKTVVTYTLTEKNQLVVDYFAESSRATPFNITNHSYFNLAGHDAGSIREHRLQINADQFLPTDETAIPYGDAMDVAGTPFDFRSAQTIGARVDADHDQLRFARGYDHTYCLRQPADDGLRFAARAVDPLSGRVLEVYTTEPGMQFYSGNFLDGALPGKSGCRYIRRGGFCLETQHYPDSPNQPKFPDSILRPGNPYISKTVFSFSAV